MARARYGAGPSSGFRTTSTLINPASPSASLTPPPSAVSTSRKKVVWLAANPRKSVATLGRLGVREQADRGVVGRGCGLRVSATDQGEQQQRPDSSPANAVSDETLHRVGHYFLCLMNLAHGVWSTNSRG